MTNDIRNSEGMGYWLGLILKVILAVGMLVYLGKHSLNFFMWTFQGDDEIYAWLGLLTTSAGVIIWLLAFKFVARNTWERAIALIMMMVALLGEFAVAGFDMWMNISGQISEVQWTQDDLRAMAYVVAGLALLNGLALIADVAGMDIIEGLRGVSAAKKIDQPAQEVAPNFLLSNPLSRGNGAKKFGMNVQSVESNLQAQTLTRSPAQTDAGSGDLDGSKPKS